MTEKMTKSTFQFITPYLTELEFEFNKEFNPNEKFELKESFHKDISRYPNENKAYVELSLQIDAEKNKPFRILISFASEFVWEDFEGDVGQIDEALDRSASLVLLSYMRPIVSQITGMSPLPSYEVPFYVFSE